MQISITKLSLSFTLASACALMVYQAPGALATDPTDQAAAAGNSATSKTAADESPVQFVQRYLQVVSTAKSPKQIMPFLKPRPDRPPMPEATSAEEKKMEAEMMAAFLEMQRASTPKKVALTDTQDRDGKVLLIFQVTEVDPTSKLNLNEKGAAASGKVLLEKGTSGWLIADEFWHYVYPTGLTTDSGHDPDAAPKVATPIDKYSDDIMSALNKIWSDPVKGTGQVTVELKNTSSGQFEVIGISDKHGSKEAEAAVKDAIAKISLPPLPSEVSEQPIVNIQLCWSPKSKDTLKVVQLLHSASLAR